MPRTAQNTAAKTTGTQNRSQETAAKRKAKAAEAAAAKAAAEEAAAKEAAAKEAAQAEVDPNAETKITVRMTNQQKAILMKAVEMMNDDLHFNGNMTTFVNAAALMIVTKKVSKDKLQGVISEYIRPRPLDLSKL